MSLIADLSNFDLNTLGDTGKCPYSDFLYIVRTYENNRYRFHLVGYELSTHNMPTIAKGLNLSEPDDVYESLRRGNSAMAKKPLPGYLNHSFTERIEGYCPTGTPPTSEQLRSWLPLEIAESIQHADMKSMQDAHAELVKYAWTQYDADIFVMSGTPGIGKTTALRNILANYDSGYSLIYISPRIQVNADLIAKFDPSDDGNRLAGKEELVCLTTNSVLISTAQAHYGRPALSCCSRELPDDPKFLFLRPEDAEALETRTFANPAEPSRNRTGYKSLEKGGAGEGTGSFGHGVFNTMMQAVHRLNVRGEWDIASVEKFARNVRELVFFIDEVTGDRAGRQTAQEIIRFRKEVKMLFEEAGKSCPIRFRIIIADASLVNASSVETFLNRTTSQPDQILFNGDADSKGLSIEDARIMGLPCFL